jgi:hypothetical protein
MRSEAIGNEQPFSRRSLIAVDSVEISSTDSEFPPEWPVTRISKYVTFAPMTPRRSWTFSVVPFGSSQDEITRRTKYWHGHQTKSILLVGKATPRDEHSLRRTKKARLDLLIWRQMARMSPGGGGRGHRWRRPASGRQQKSIQHPELIARDYSMTLPIRPHLMVPSA